MPTPSVRSVFGAHGDHVIWVGQTEPPHDAEWAAYVELLRQTGDRLRARKMPVRVLVLTDGCAPTATQRQKLVDGMKGTEVYSAVISTNLMMRSIVTVLSWFQVENKFFVPSEIGAACNFLQIAPDEREGFWKKAIQLEAQMPGKLVKAVSVTSDYLNQGGRLRSA